MITLDPPNLRTHGSRPRSATGKPASPSLTATRLTALRGFFQRARKATPIAGQVSVLLTTDRTLRRLNREFRGKDKPTDVLSFPAADFSEINSRAAKKADAHVGDLAISLDTAARQARSFGHALEVELRILLLHGLLHLAGFDHEVDNGEMAAREEILRRRFRLPVSLIARVSSPAAGPASRPFAKRGRA